MQENSVGFEKLNTERDLNVTAKKLEKQIKGLKKLTEWDLNRILDILFLSRYKNDYIVLFQDGDLHQYVDRRLKPEKCVKTRKETGIPVDPQKFRPDMVLLDKRGQPYIVETKTDFISSESKCIDLVVQSIVYANVIFSLFWKGASTCDIYEFLDLLLKAHMFVLGYKVEHIDLQEAHKLYFNLHRQLGKHEFQNVPHVIFLLAKVNLPTLVKVCKLIKESNFIDFKQYVKDSRFRKRVEDIQNNWESIQKMKFFIMPVYLPSLSVTIGERFDLI